MNIYYYFMASIIQNYHSFNYLLNLIQFKIQKLKISILLMTIHNCIYSLIDLIKILQIFILGMFYYLSIF